MEKKILVMGKHIIEDGHKGPLKQIMGLTEKDEVKMTFINKPITHILTRDEIKEYDLILSLQNNPIILRRILVMANDCNVPIVKPFRDRNKVLTHFMKVNEVIVDYKYELVKVHNTNQIKPRNKHNKRAVKKSN